jgi:hypothetical protein
LAVLLCAACTSPPPSETETPGPLTEPLSFANAPGQDLGPQLAARMAELGVVVDTATTRSDRYGSWNPLKLSANAAALSFDPTTLYTDDPDAEWDLTQVAAAWKTAADFLVSEWIDSELVWDDTPQNRQTVADRIEERAYFFLIDQIDFVDLFDQSGGGLSPTSLGPWAVDQDYADWRQEGPPTLKTDDPVVADNQLVFSAGLVSAEPAPYASGQPRTYITNLEPIGLQTTDNPATGTEFILRTLVSYYRPVQVDGQTGTRYETGEAYIAFLVVASGSYGLLGGFQDAQISRNDVASVSAADVARLPTLAEAVGGVPQATMDRWGFSLPADAEVDEDSSCADDVPEDYAGDYATYDLQPASDLRAGCLEIWRFAADAPTAPTDAMLYPTTKLWRLANGQAIGTVAVDAYPTHDSLTLTALDQSGGRLTFQAVVPAGQGEAAATTLAASIQISG